MARKARHRISYVVPLANSPGGHRLGLNGLTVDVDRSILYSGGRDGLICAWDLNCAVKQDLSTPHASAVLHPVEDSKFIRNSDKPESSLLRRQVQAHTHWINDIILTRDNSALVSASSDLAVKLWRPHSEDSQIPNTIGLHSDYVKCLASPSANADWVASGGLDHKIKVWDLNGGGEKLQIDIGKPENNKIGSVYALSASESIMASGGPECIVRLWDPQSGKRITNFVGHTGSVRDILINQDGNTVMTASSDQTIKIWSITAGRCMYTLTMHNESVWSLFSNHPQLSVFYSTDRSGLVAKTDVRGSPDMDQGLSLAIAQEHEGVCKMVVAGDYLWTATSSSSINRWKDVDTKGEIQPVEIQEQRASSILPPSKASSEQISTPTHVKRKSRTKIPFSSILQISSNAIFPGERQRDLDSSSIYSRIGTSNFSEISGDPDLGIVIPYHNLPEETIEGQNGLIKHLMLNDKRRVLTLDTAGEVMMWDLLSCVPIQSFGKRHLEEVAPELNTIEIVPNWCSVDTRTGRLACDLTETYCFEAEMYADDLGIDGPEGKDDFRVNLGHWVLRSLFANLVREELNRDSEYRTKLGHYQKSRRPNAPPYLQLPSAPFYEGFNDKAEDSSQMTPRNAVFSPTATPGLSIRLATPHPSHTNPSAHAQSHLSSPQTERQSLEKSQYPSQSRASSDKASDYFSSNPNRQTPTESHTKTPTSPWNGPVDASSQPGFDQDKEEKSKEGTTLFKKKFRMNFPKKLGRFSAEPKPAVADEKSEESDKSESKDEKGAEDNFLGTIQNIRKEYEENILRDPLQPIPTLLEPDLQYIELLEPPPSTTIIIQEDLPDSGSVADIYQGTVESVGEDADLIEKTAPMWLGELLLRGKPPPKEISKVAFVLLPYEDRLPHVSVQDGNSRLTANRMLRVKKILIYIAEHLESPAELEEGSDGLKPENYLELYCHNQLIPPSTTLSTLRFHYWKTPGDVVLYYKSNGKKASLANLERRMNNDTPEEHALRG